MSEPDPQVDDLPPHRLAVALLQPQIAPNTGNIARLCVATNCQLHLVRPLGFVLSDHNLRRSAMDYWHRLRLMMHDDTAAFLEQNHQRRMWLFDSCGARPLWTVDFTEEDVLVFGSETRGIELRLLEAQPAQTVRIPQTPSARCLNLSSAAGVAVYEALRQIREKLLGRSAED